MLVVGNVMHYRSILRSDPEEVSLHGVNCHKEITKRNVNYVALRP